MQLGDIEMQYLELHFVSYSKSEIRFYTLGDISSSAWSVQRAV
jgi:hypothetical protein